eukprot:TRINITY_DN39999_c0_g1_i1.p1 TRINITY_DN39999_c0_g1~~TRINITY_DN39999_c0_g1_i1.p1  ORF type:complete len:116 (+),score=2.03 TRINITY_DN39999_c0_g1_i1:66-413(+)
MFGGKTESWHWLVGRVHRNLSPAVTRAGHRQLTHGYAGGRQSPRHKVRELRATQRWMRSLGILILKDSPVTSSGEAARVQCTVSPPVPSPQGKSSLLGVVSVDIELGPEEASLPY